MRTAFFVNEVFYSPQGEGVRAGTMNVFVRFVGCNMECQQEAGPKSPGGFDCDTEFMSGRKVSVDELSRWCADEVRAAGLNVPEDGLRACEAWAEPWLILTGGEPGLQIDTEFVRWWHERGVRLAIETNGSLPLPAGLDWITVSPKVAEHAIRQRSADEVKYVRSHGQSIPKTVVQASHYLLSPAFNGLDYDIRSIHWCAKLCKENPAWRLSAQLHKLLRQR